MEPQNNIKPPAAEKPWNVIIKKVLSIVDVNVRGAETVTIYNITLTAPTMEYAQALPDKTKAIEFKCRAGNTVYYSFTAGKVAGPTAPYLTNFGTNIQKIEGLNLTGKTIYFAGTNAGDVLEMIVFT